MPSSSAHAFEARAGERLGESTAPHLVPHAVDLGLTSRPPSLPCHDHRGGIPTSCEVPPRVLSATLHPSLGPVACCSRILRFLGFESLPNLLAQLHTRGFCQRGLRAALWAAVRLLSAVRERRPFMLRSCTP